jgi:glucose-1-phosphate thymidylyltransferase
MKCIISAAGYAIRLYPLTENQPKPLLLIKNKPIINHIIEKVDKIKDIEDIYVVSNNRFYSKFSAWKEDNQQNFSKKLHIVDEYSTSPENQRGAIFGGLVAITENNIADDIFVIYADNLFSLDPGDFIDFSKKKQASCLACYKLQNIEDARKFGVISINEDCKIIDIEEKPQQPKSSLIVTGLYIIMKEDIEKLKEFFKKSEEKSLSNSGLSFTYFFKDIHVKQDVYGFPFSGQWIDIGNKEDYEKIK